MHLVPPLCRKTEFFEKKHGGGPPCTRLTEIALPARKYLSSRIAEKKFIHKIKTNQNQHVEK